MPKPRNRLVGLRPPVDQPLELNRHSPQALGLFAAWPLLATQSVKLQRELFRGFLSEVVGTVQWLADPVRGNALRCDGNADGGVRNTNMIFPGSNPITVMFWTRVMTADVGNGHSAFSIGDGAAGTLNEVQAHVPWGDNTLYWDCGGASGSARISTSYTNYLDKWTHVALVSAGNGGNFKAIYLDGVLAASAASSSGPTSAPTGVYIGYWHAGSDAHKGLLSDFRVYSVVLPAEIIKAAASFETAYDLYWPSQQRVLKAAPTAGKAHSFAVIVG